MGDVLTSMVLFWALMLLAYFAMQNGLSIFNDVTKAMSRFMLEKALGPESIWSKAGTDPLLRPGSFKACSGSSQHRHWFSRVFG